MAAEEYVTVRKLAKALGVSESTVRLGHRFLPTVRTGRGELLFRASGLPKALGFLLQETVHRMSFKRLDKAETPFFDGVFD
jgi:hypothetical protein